MIQPVLIAGSNGCGKSTLTSFARAKFQQMPVLDPDAIASSIQEDLSSRNSHNSSIEAGRQVLRLAEQLMMDRQSYTVETTLSGSTYLKMASRARHAGYILLVIYVGTTSVEINIERIKARVMKGGHDVPEQDQRRRYPRTLANMKKLLPLADLAVILDNSHDSGHTMVGFGRKGSMRWIEPLPAWTACLLEG